MRAPAGGWLIAMVFARVVPARWCRDFSRLTRTGALPPGEAAEHLSCYQIPLLSTRPVATSGKVIAAAGLGGSIALKADAKGTVCRSEAGAVKLDLHTGRGSAPADAGSDASSG